MRELIGKPWAVPCDPPRSYDCYELVIAARHMMGLTTPSIVDRLERKPTDRSVINNPPKVWRELEMPREGCVVTVNGRHCGMMLNRTQFIHSSAARGVAVDRLSAVGGRYRFWELDDADD